MNLSACRLVLLIALIPCLFRWLSGHAGRIQVPDLGILFFCMWGALALMHAHGFEVSLQPAGMLFIETMGAYLLGRCFIRTAGDFRAMVRMVARLVVLLSPFALFEWVTNTKPLLSGFGLVFATPELLFETRSGFSRVQGPFSHSIEFGVFCGSIFALALMTRSSRHSFSVWLMGFVIGGCALLSMSSASAAILVLLAAILGWNWVLSAVQGRWMILGALLFMAYLVVEFGSNQTPIQFYISRFTFDPGTGWWRLLIWEHGSASVRNFPLFGIGLGDWVRPPWMFSASVDNFWLVNAMRYGLPAFFLLLVSSIWMLVAIAFTGGLNDEVRRYRLAYISSMVALFLIGCTVHFWGAIYAWFCFMLGAGGWFIEAGASARVAERRDAPPVRARPGFSNPLITNPSAARI